MKNLVRVNGLMSDENRMNFDEKESEGYHDGGKEKRGVWQRVKWTDQMVKLLISAVNYVEQYASSDGVQRKPSMGKKIGKWRCVSTIMVKRGYHVSPQQCEDKFNDLSKRYKRINYVLGSASSCKVVEKPELLGMMNVSDKAKEEVKKILSSKNLFYEEMRSYHNGNRLHLPCDSEVQHSLQLALRSRDADEPNQPRQHKTDDDFDKEQQDAGAGDVIEEIESKRSKQMNEMKDVIVGYPLNIKGYGIKVGATKQDDQMNVNHVYSNDSSADGLKKQWVTFRLLQLKKQKLQIQIQKCKLEKQQFKWQRINRNKGRVLDKMRLENQCMKLDNERLAFELKHKLIAVSKTEYML